MYPWLKSWCDLKCVERSFPEGINIERSFDIIDDEKVFVKLHIFCHISQSTMRIIRPLLSQRL